MVLKHLNEEVYMPKDKTPLISLKGHDYFPKPQQSRFKQELKKRKMLQRIESMPSLENLKGIPNLKERTPGSRSSLIVPNKQKSKFMRTSTILPDSISRSARLSINIENKDTQNLLFEAQISPVPDTINEKETESLISKSPEIRKPRYESVMHKTHKKVGKVKFGNTTRVSNPSPPLLPKLQNTSAAT